MKKIFALFCFLVATNAAFATQKVFISQVVDHPALDITINGIVDGLEELGYKNGANLELRIESAQNSSVLAAQIASKFVNQNPDVVVGVGTISAQSFAKYAQEDKTKLIFSSVTDPISASLVKNLKQPGNNTSGVSNFVDLESQLKLIKKIQPKLTSIGIIYNPGESNSISIINKLEIICPKMNITLVKQAVQKSSDVAQAAVKLTKQVDAVWVNNDNTTLSAIQSVIRAANKSGIPVYASDTDLSRSGVLAVIGPNQYQIGKQTAKMIANVLKGKSPSTMPVEFPQETSLYINSEAAKSLGIQISADIRAVNNEPQ